MSIKWISSAWRDNLKTFDADHRAYVDFRQQVYPVVAGAPTFTKVTSADNRPGSHYLSGGYGKYLMPLTSYVVVDVLVKPTMAYNVGNLQRLVSWYIDSTHYLSINYDAIVGEQSWGVLWKDGATLRFMWGGALQFTDNATFQQWTRLTYILDLSSTATTGSTFYMNGSQEDSGWDGAKDARASNFPTMELRAMAGTAYPFDIAYARVWLLDSAAKLPTATDVANNFKTYKEEEIVFHLNGHATGHTRCNVTSRLRQLDIERTVESPAGGTSPNRCGLTLSSPSGQFADDQYAAFDAGAEIYNGTSSQKYMQARCPVEVETWYGGTYELEFAGRVDDGMFQRRTGIGEKSEVTLSAYDAIDELKRKVKQRALSYEAYTMCDNTTEASSLVHRIARLGTAQEWYNFAANAAFASTAPTASWALSGGAAAFSRSTNYSLLDTYSGALTASSSQAIITQVVSFPTTGDKHLNVGQKWNYSIWARSTGTVNYALYVYERTSGGVTISSTATTGALVAGSNWIRADITKTITDSSGRQIAIAYQNLSTGELVYVELAQLIQNDRPLNCFVPNTATGSAGTFLADNAMSTTYETIGFDVDDVAITHPWAVIEAGKPMGAYLSEISDATVARYMGCDSAGTLKYRTIFKTGYADPSTLYTIDSARDIGATIAAEQANKIIVHGSHIVVGSTSRQELLWRAADTNDFDRSNGGAEVFEAIANGASWPPSTLYGEYWAKYEDALKPGVYKAGH